MMKALALEFYKLRRKRIFAMMTLFLGAELAWAFVSISMSMSRHPDSTSWEALLVTVASMNGLFVPIMSAVAVSRICDMEHKGDTWKLLATTAVRRSRLYWAKYWCANILILYYISLQAAAIAGFGIVKGFAEPLPFSLLIPYIGGALLTSMAIVALQQWISLSVKNQAFALSLGMIGGFIGMAADFFPAGVRRLFIWSYYTGLSPVIYQYSNLSVDYRVQPLETGSLAFMSILIIILFTAGCFHFSRQEI
ncbi:MULTISPECIES: ABC transporter permease [Paenibacillus]|uniref:ABC transporter permease n=1 Tax=Paenibacillus residui TaxID=629724 RepID=A0ABW3DE04_9BACL